MTGNPIVPAGFQVEVGTDPAEDLCGPFYLNRDGSQITAGLRVAPQHCNGMQSVHGGILMTFADFALCAQARYQTDDAHIVTVSLNCEFLDTAPVGTWLESNGHIVRRSNRLVFVQGVIHDEGRPVLMYNGIGKRVRQQRGNGRNGGRQRDDSNQ